MGRVRRSLRRRLTRGRPSFPSQPVSKVFGFDRGTPVDRYYIERFLQANRGDIHGRVLEIAERTYTERFGTDVEASEVLHVQEAPGATLVGDLQTGAGVPTDAFDCVIVTQTLQHVWDVPAAIRTLHIILSEGGVALVTVPGVSQISRYDMDRWGDFWRFTDMSVRRLFAEEFGDANVRVETHGNVASACALLQGFASQELGREQLDVRDQDYQVVLTARAVRGPAGV